MKKNLLIKKSSLWKIMVVFILGTIALPGNAQTRLVDDIFNYNEGDLVGQGGWTQVGSSAATPIQVVSNALAYEGYIKDATTKSVEIKNSGQDAFKSIGKTITSESVYASVLINFNTVQAANAGTSSGDYFMHFGDGTSTLYLGRLFVKKSSGGDKMVFGVVRATSPSATTNWTTTEYDLNKTHLIVLKYTFVDGEKNDIISLYVNPDTSGETEPTPDIVSNPAETQADSQGISAVYIRQGSSGKTPLGYVGAIRVTESWADIFDSAEPPLTPSITLSSSTAMFGSVYSGGTYTKTINVKAENLTEDITIGGLTSGEITVPSQTITKAQAEAEEGFDLVLTFNPVDQDKYMDEITFDSEGAIQKKATAYWATTIAKVATSISDLRSQYVTDGETFRITGEVAISYIFIDGTNRTIYIQDENSAITINDNLGKLSDTYKAGDKIKNIVGTLKKSFGTSSFESIGGEGELISENNIVIPTTVTLEDLKTTPVNYEARLIKIESASFFNRANENDGKFSDVTDNQANRNKIKQGETEAQLWVRKGVDFVGNDIPEFANITGISTSGAGNVVAPRAAADIVEVIYTPEITVTGSAMFGSVYSGKTYTKTINVKGKYLKGDITIGDLTSGEITVPSQTITKAQAEAENGFDLVLTFNPLDPEKYMETITFDSQDAVQKKVTSYWSTTLVKNAASISELRSLYTDDGEMFRITGDVLISYIFVDGSNKTVFIQDENSAITINDNLGKLSDTYKAGDKLKDIMGTLKKSFGTFSFESMEGEGKLVSENNPVTPTTVTLEDLKATPVNYEARLIKVEKASFYNRANENDGKFSDVTSEQANKNKIRQNGTEIELWVRKGVDFVGNTIPAIADVTGISTSGSGTLIAPRAAADIVESVAVITLTGSPTFGEVYTGNTYTKTINVKAENLIADITLSGMTTGELSASTTTVTKAQAEAAGGFDVVLTLTPADLDEYMDVVMFDSEGAAQKKVTAFWEAKELVTATSITDLRAKYAAYPTEEEAKAAIFNLTGEVIVSYVYTDGSKKSLYTFDNEAGITIYDAFGDLTTIYTAGDAIKDLMGTIEKNAKGTLSFIPKADFGAPVSQGNTVTPVVATLAELQANPGTYEARLVKVERITFPDMENDGVFTAGTNNKISQSETNAVMRVFNGADFIGSDIPQLATIIGVSTEGDGTVIAPRTNNDIESLPVVGIENIDQAKINIWSENSSILIAGEKIETIEVFSLTGVRIVKITAIEDTNMINVPQGTYLVTVKTNGKTVTGKVFVK